MSSNRVVDLRRGKVAPPVRRNRYAPPPKRHSPLKARRQRRRAVWTALLSLGFMLGAYGIHWVSYIPAVTYRVTEIHGNVVLNAGDIGAYIDSYLKEKNTGFISGINIFRFRTADLEKAIANHFRRVKEVKVIRESYFGNALLIDLNERQSFAQWCDPSHTCFALDPNGIVFAPLGGEATSTFATPFIFEGPLATTTTSYATLLPIAGAFASGHFSGLVSLLQSLGAGNYPALGAKIENTEDIKITLASGFYIKVSIGQDPDRLVKDLTLVLNSEPLKNKVTQLEYIDLRFGNKVFYRFMTTPEIE